MCKVGKMEFKCKDKIHKRPGTKLITKFPEGEIGVGIIQFQGKVVVATNKGIYELNNNELKPIEVILEGDSK